MEGPEEANMRCPTCKIDYDRMIDVMLENQERNLERIVTSFHIELDRLKAEIERLSAIEHKSTERHACGHERGREVADCPCCGR